MRAVDTEASDNPRGVRTRVTPDAAAVIGHTPVRVRSVAFRGVGKEVLEFVATLVLATMADRWGRRKMMLIGSVFQVFAALIFFPIFDTGVFVVAVLAGSIALIANTTRYAPLPAVISDLFPARCAATNSNRRFSPPRSPVSNRFAYWCRKSKSRRFICPSSVQSRHHGLG